jgi:hypothetical protein
MMALADYYLCDVCECKTFYDAVCEFDQYNQNPNTGHPWPNGDVGYMVVLCKDCAATHSVTITEKTPNEQPERPR